MHNAVGVVYFLTDGTDAIKIGHTVYHPQGRIINLQPGNPRKLCLAASFPADPSVERWIHTTLYEERIQLNMAAEWYPASGRPAKLLQFAELYTSDDLVQISDLHQVIGGKKEPWPSDIGLRISYARRRLMLAISELPHGTTIARLESGKQQTVTGYVLRDIAIELGVPLDWLIKGEVP